MNKTHLTYLIMILVFALGLWGILHAGSRLRAAPDAAGEWTMTWERPDAKLPGRMKVNQSGRFVNAMLARPDGRNMKLRGTLEWTGKSRADLTLKAVDDPSTFTAIYDPSSQTLAGTAEGSGRWHASRVLKESSR